jgi:hypothetical protein
MPHFGGTPSMCGVFTVCLCCLVIDDGLRGSGSHSDSFDIGSASVCLVDFALSGIFFFGQIGGYPAFSLWNSKLVWIFILLDFVLVSLCGRGENQRALFL